MNRNCANFGELKRKPEALVSPEARLEVLEFKRKMNFFVFLGSEQSNRHNGESRPVLNNRE